MGKKIKMGVIGLGGRGRSLIRTASENKDVEVTAVCDLNEDCLELTKQMFEERGLFNIKYFSSLEDLINSDVEAVIVAVPIELHCDVSIELLNAKKHVICEIPIFSNMDEAKRLCRAVTDNPEVSFMTAENCCFWAFVHSWKKMYESDMLGRVVVAEAQYLHNTERPIHHSIREDKWRAFLPAITYITHSLGPLVFMTGDECVSVCGFAPEYNPYKEEHPADPNGIAIIRTKSGAIFKILISFGTHSHCVHNFALHCVEGTLQTQFNLDNFDHEGCETIAQLRKVPCIPGDDYLRIPLGLGFPKSKHKGGHGGADAETIGSFVDSLLKNEKPALGFKEGYNMSMPGILAQESILNGSKEIKIPSIEELLK